MTILGVYVSIYSGLWWILGAFLVLVSTCTIYMSLWTSWQLLRFWKVFLVDPEYDRTVGPFEDALDIEREKARRQRGNF
jgi:cytochrome c-type biogenesis protein CcmH/NrfG